VLRGALLAGTSAALAVAAHAVAGGMLPSTGLTVLLTVGVAAAGIALADRRRGPVAILFALGSAHLGIHLMLSVAATGEPMASRPVNGWLMAGGHLLAVLLAAAVLTRAEDAVFALAAAWAMLLPRWSVGPLPPRIASLRLPTDLPPVDRLLAVLLRRSCARRGPPLTC
jgi:hypothetical protein